MPPYLQLQRQHTSEVTSIPVPQTPPPYRSPCSSSSPSPSSSRPSLLFRSTLSSTPSPLSTSMYLPIHFTNSYSVLFQYRCGHGTVSRNRDSKCPLGTNPLFSPFSRDRTAKRSLPAAPGPAAAKLSVSSRTCFHSLHVRNIAHAIFSVSSRPVRGRRTPLATCSYLHRLV